MKSSTIAEQVEQARKALRRMKKAKPDSFIEYSNLKFAKTELLHAKQQLKKAKKAWKQIGKKKND